MARERMAVSGCWRPASDVRRDFKYPSRSVILNAEIAMLELGAEPEELTMIVRLLDRHAPLIARMTVLDSFPPLARGQRFADFADQGDLLRHGHEVTRVGSSVAPISRGRVSASVCIRQQIALRSRTQRIGQHVSALKSRGIRTR